MTDGHTCPVSGCDYGEQDNKSLAAVRSHINASGDSEHDWSELKAEVTGETETEESSEESSEETTEETEETEETMPTEEEYREQYEQDSETEDGEESSEESSSGGFDLPIPDLSPMTWLLIIGALVLLYWYTQRDSGAVSAGEADLTEEEQEDSGSDGLTNEEVSLVE